jgi:sarcosine oxidase subunit delta
MLLVTCHYCGERPEIEFRCGGEAHIARPADPSALDDEAWSEFLFYRSNATTPMAAAAGSTRCATPPATSS